MEEQVVTLVTVTQFYLGGTSLSLLIFLGEGSAEEQTRHPSHESEGPATRQQAQLQPQ